MPASSTPPRAFEKWEAGWQLYEVALRAASAERAARWSSVREMKGVWDGVGGN